MFNGLLIELTEPICSCNEEQIDWELTKDSALKFTCRTCDTTLEVPGKNLTAGFTFNKPYPGKKIENKRTLLRLVKHVDDEKSAEPSSTN